MTPAIVCALALFAFDRASTPPVHPNHAFRGTQELDPRYTSGRGMTLDMLNGLPPIRPTPPPPPQVWVYQSNNWVTPAPFGLGGYRPGTGGYYSTWSPAPFGLGGYRPPGTGGYYSSPWLFWGGR